MNERIKQEHWFTLLEVLKSEHIYSSIVGRLKKVYSKSVIQTRHTHNVRYLVPWFNNEIKTLIEHKRFL